VLVGRLTLPAAGKVALRARLWRRALPWWTVPAACGTTTDVNRVDDQDDLVFVVAP
jgi:hypothetical protein